MKLNPDSQFTPTLEKLEMILSLYSLVPQEFELAKSGIENCTVFVTTQDGIFVLRIYRQDKKTKAEIEIEADFIQYLHDHGVPVPVPMSNKLGSMASEVTIGEKVWQAILMPQLDGSHAETYSDELLQSLAKTQATMHLLAKDYKHHGGTHPLLSELRESHFINLIGNRAALDPIRAGFIDRAEAYVVKLDQDLPSGLCHLDYDNGNVLSRSDRITAVLDFDDLAYAPFVMCLAYTVWDVLFDSGMEGVQKYLSTYNQYRQLSKEELGMLLPIVLFRHYAIGCKDIADRQMGDNLLSQYIRLEATIKASAANSLL